MAAPMVQITHARDRPDTGTIPPIPGQNAAGRKPAWLKVRSPGGANYARIRKLMRELNLNTVCEEARCPFYIDCLGNLNNRCRP